MNSRPAPQHPLARPLRACARGIYPDEAAIEMLIGHGTFLDRDDFTRHITTSERGRPGGEAAHAAIDWTAATTALDAGTLPCSGGERRIFRLPASRSHIHTSRQDPVNPGDQIKVQIFEGLPRARLSRARTECSVAAMPGERQAPNPRPGRRC